MDISFDLGTLLRKHKKQFKNKPIEFVNTAGGVQKRLAKNLKERKSKRLSVLDKLRNLPKSESPVKLSEPEQKEENRRQQLEKWKEEKKKRRKEESLQRKKPFLTGVVHVPLKFELPPPIKPKPSTSGCITRSQAAKIAKEKNDDNTKSNKYSFAPKNASFRPPKILVKTQQKSPVSKKDMKGNTITFQPILLNNKSKDKTKILNGKLTKQQKKETKETQSKPIGTILSKQMTVAIVHIEKCDNQLHSSSSSEVDQLAPKSYQMATSPSLEPKTPSTSIVKLEKVTPIAEPNREKVNKISPCVTVSRGKENARREMMKKMKEGLLDEDTSNMDNVDHFRRQLASEIKRITEMCETWEKINEQTQLPDIAQEAILAAVGQARLLMSKKLVQFGVLVERCARPDPAFALVTPADLHGFWDMVFMQVENVDVRFMKLNKLKEQGWVDEQPTEMPRKVVKPFTKKPTKPNAGSSKIREMIAAARKAKKEQEQTGHAPVSEKEERKSFEAGFFSVRSPVHSPANTTTPKQKTSMLKAVLSNEANKASLSKQAASFVMLRTSLLGKNLEYDGIAPLPQTPLAPVNLEATPSRSILKSAKGIEKSGNRSLKVVMFDKYDTEIQNVSIEDDSAKLQNGKKEADYKIEINGEVEELIDDGVSLMNLNEDSGKENSTRKEGRKSRLSKQCNEDSSMLTRRMRRSIMSSTPVVNVDVIVPRSTRSSARKTLHEVQDNVTETAPLQTPKRASRRRKSKVCD